MQNFNLIKWPNGIEWLDLKANAIEEGLAFSKERSITHFICDFHPTDNIQDLSFLNSVIVHGLNITFSGLRSNAEINGFRDMRILISLFGSPVSLLDLSNLTNLQELEITSSTKLVGLSALVNLQKLRLWKYSPETKDLQAFKDLKKIRKIQLVKAAIETLDGIENLDKLQELRIQKPKGFKRFLFGPLDNSLGALEKLEFAFCKEFDFNTIPGLPNLEELKITDSGKEIPNLEFISKFPNLKSLIFTRTELIEGNLNYLLQHPHLEKVILDHKKHYNLAEKEINKLLAAKKEK